MKINLNFFMLAALFLVTGCAISLHDGAEVVQLIYTQPKADACQFLGQTSASDGGMVSGDFMTDAKIHKGAANHMKNKAHKMGGNVVYIQQQFDKNKGLTVNKTNQTMVGFVYQCVGLKQAQSE